MLLVLCTMRLAAESHLRTFVMGLCRGHKRRWVVTSDILFAGMRQYSVRPKVGNCSLPGLRLRARYGSANVSDITSPLSRVVHKFCSMTRLEKKTSTQPPTKCMTLYGQPQPAKNRIALASLRDRILVHDESKHTKRLATLV